MLAASWADSRETSGPRFGSVSISPSLSSSRSASRTDARLTPGSSQKILLDEALPGAKRPLVIAVRSISATCWRTGAATGATRMDRSVMEIAPDGREYPISILPRVQES